jgi:glycosyltransferase involved in cell wall biosynthesis
VIATPLGSMPELIRDGVTGFLVADEDAAVTAVGRLGELDRHACRDVAVGRFHVQRMVDAYLSLFADVIAGGLG